MEPKYKVKQITKLYESCDRCGLPIINCICSRIPVIKTKAEIWILCSGREFYRPSNTARLLKLANPQATEIILWERTKPSQELIAKINSDDYEPYILFPDENDDGDKESLDKALEISRGNSEKTQSYADDNNEVNAEKSMVSGNCYTNAEKVILSGDDGRNIEKIIVSEYNDKNSENTLTCGGSEDRNSQKTAVSEEAGRGSEKTKAFILLDGTWKEAAKMYRKSDYLKKLPRITLKPEHKSEYTLRKGAGEGELCTIEAAIEVLKLNGEEKEAAIIKDVFDLFMKGFKAGAVGVSIFD